jgi:HEPN domain-containing protein
MQCDERAAEIGGWLTRAQEDLRAADVLIDADPPLAPNAAFHCQQAVEKGLKALLTRLDHVFRKTHDIGELAIACVTFDPSLEHLLRRATPLTEYAWRFRHPGDVFEPDVGEARDALKTAREVAAAVEDAIGLG